MFRVENADFIADKLAAELLPNQEYREVLKNALEAVERRMTAEGVKTGGRIEFDVDWDMLGSVRRWYISCADNGDGMGRSELERYTTTLAVQGAGRRQSLKANQGMGLKVSGPTRHKKGVIIRSMKNDERTMVQVGWNEDAKEYGLIPVGPNDELVMPVPTSNFPAFIRNQKSGTVVTFLGSSDDADTFVGPTKGWLFKYLNTRFFRLSNDGIEVVVRVPAGEKDEWPRTVEEATERMKKQGKSFNLTGAYGTGAVWADVADPGQGGHKDVLQLPGDPSRNVPPAKVHWWVLPVNGDPSSRTHSGGSFAVLFQNELHDWKWSNQANPFFARLGVLFGKSRIAFILEPLGTDVTSDFARAHVLVGGTPVFETDAWLVWADQFRAEIPDPIRKAMAEEQARIAVEDPDRMKRIRERLREVLQFLRPRRFRRSTEGKVRAGGPEVTGPGAGSGPILDQSPRTGIRRRSPGGRGIGAVLSEVEDPGTPATEVSVATDLEPLWVTEEQAESMSIVSGNTNGLHDRAAALNGMDGRTAPQLLLNQEFRGYQAILRAINDWANPEGDDDKSKKIEALAREWIEQKMIEAVEGLRQLENGRTWITEHFDEALSPVALTAAFMADRYHTLREVKRAVGALRQVSPAATS